LEREAHLVQTEIHHYLGPQLVQRAVEQVAQMEDLAVALVVAVVLMGHFQVEQERLGRALPVAMVQLTQLEAVAVAEK
jgi:hypothetical protein